MRMRDLLKERKFLREKIEEVEKGLLAQLHEELGVVKAQIRNQCKHPEKFVETKRLTIEGSYYDRGEYHRWRECSQCGAKSEVEITDGGYG